MTLSVHRTPAREIFLKNFFAKADRFTGSFTFLYKEISIYSKHTKDKL